MKKLSLLLIIPLSILSACQAEKVPENSAEISPISTATTEKSTDNTTTPTPVVTASTEAKTAPAVDSSEGESLHTENCTRCHGSEVYTRADRKVTSLEALSSQVRMCDSQLETQLFPEDMEKLTHYLNQTYYKF